MPHILRACCMQHHIPLATPAPSHDESSFVDSLSNTFIMTEDRFTHLIHHIHCGYCKQDLLMAKGVCGFCCQLMLIVTIDSLFKHANIPSVPQGRRRGRAARAALGTNP